MKRLLFAMAVMLLTCTVIARGDTPAGADRAPEDRDLAIARIKMEKARVEQMQTHYTRVLGAVEDRLEELRSREQRAKDLEEQLTEKTVSLEIDGLKAFPAVWRSSVIGEWLGEGALKVLELEDKLRELLHLNDEVLELAAQVADPATPGTIAKVNREIVDLKNEIAICDWFVKAYDKKLDELTKPVDSAAISGSWGPFSNPIAAINEEIMRIQVRLQQLQATSDTSTPASSPSSASTKAADPDGRRGDPVSHPGPGGIGGGSGAGRDGGGGGAVGGGSGGGAGGAGATGNGGPKGNGNGGPKGSGNGGSKGGKGGGKGGSEPHPEVRHT
jgi:hypothetical protein